MISGHFERGDGRPYAVLPVDEVAGFLEECRITFEMQWRRAVEPWHGFWPLRAFGMKYGRRNMRASTSKRIADHVASLSAPDMAEAEHAESCLIRYYGARATEHLLAAVGSENAAVRHRVAWVLGHTRDARAFDALVRLTRDPDGGVRYDAAIALGILDDPRSVDALAAIVGGGDVATDLKGAAANGLQRLGAAAVPPLLELLGSSDSEIVEIVARTLGWIGDESAIDGLAALLTSGEEGIRIVVIESLGAIGTERCRSLLDPFRLDASQEVCDVATYWLHEIARDRGGRSTTGRCFRKAS
jgi:HEAT repeat protein